jgi:hypothetical protein
MVHMINYQEGKTISELRQDMSTYDSREAFKAREKILMYIWMIFFCTITLVQFVDLLVVLGVINVSYLGTF